MAQAMQKARKKTLSCCYCCIEFLSGFFLLMLVASTITLLRYFLEFYQPMPAYSGNKTNLWINVTTTPKPSNQSFASAETLPQSSSMSFTVSQKLTAPLTSSSAQSSVSSVNSTVLQQTSPTNHLQQQTSDRRQTDFPQVPTEKTSSSIFPPPFVSVTQSTLLQGLTSSTKQRSAQHLLTLPVKEDSPQQLSAATEMTSQRLASTMKPLLTQKHILPLNTTHSEKPFSGQTGEEETNQYFKGSFNLVNETYHSNYSDPTSDDFRSEALKLENMINNAFAKSKLTQRYQDTSIMALKPSPFRAQFIVRMSNSIQASRLSLNTVAQEMIEGYQKAPATGVLMDEESLQVEDYNVPCLLKPASLVLLNGASDNQGDQNSKWNDSNLGTKEGFPWHITVLKDGVPVCDGSMITEKWVLSIDSCVAASDVSLYSIQFGAAGQQPRGGELYSVAKIVSHTSLAQGDLVLIQLAKSAPITPLVHPVCLPDPTLIAPAGTRCHALRSNKNDDPDILQWTVTSPSGCLLSSSPTSVCAQTYDLKMNTQMTAGGSFVCLGENEQLYLEGIVPSSTENHSQPNNEEQLVVFTRVAPSVLWIKSQVLP